MLGDPADPSKRIPGRLPFIDLHEYLEYLWRSGRAEFTDDDILLPCLIKYYTSNTSFKFLYIYIYRTDIYNIAIYIYIYIYIM